MTLENPNNEVIEAPQTPGNAATGEPSPAAATPAPEGETGQPGASGEGQAPAPAPENLNFKPREVEYIRKQTALRHQAESRASIAEAAYAALARQVNEDRRGRQPNPADPMEVVRHVAQDAVDQGRLTALRRTAEDAAQEASSIAAQTWTETEQAARSRLPDYDLVARNPNLTITPHMADAMTRMPEGADIAYYLGKNPGKAAEIASLPVREQVISLTRLVTELPSARAAVQARTSAAPPPVQALSGRQGSAQKPLDSMTTDEYVAARKAGRVS